MLGRVLWSLYAERIVGSENRYITIVSSDMPLYGLLRVTTLIAWQNGRKLIPLSAKYQNQRDADSPESDYLRCCSLTQDVFFTEKAAGYRILYLEAPGASEYDIES